MSTVVCIGGGVSLTVADLARVGRAAREQRASVVAINQAIYLAPYALVLYAADYKWWRKNIDAVHNLPCLRLTSDSSVPEQWASKLNVTGTAGFDPDRANIRTGNGSGFQALHYAMRWARRIILLGYDMQGPRWHNAYEGEPDCDYAATMAPHFESLVGPAQRLGIEIFNCSPGSALACFPQTPLSRLL